jgi:serine/threonine protein kinase
MEVTLQSFKNRFTYDPQKDLLGKGGYSEVYKAFDNEDQIYVALKIYQGDADSKYNLSNEIRKFKKLRHANVIEHIEAYEVVTGNNDIHGNPIKYQVGILEYANAGTLADLMKSGKLIGKENEAQLESIAKDIIAGLDYLHSKNIIHRDLKPSNILLFKDGDKLTPKICDFGIAKIMDNATAVSTQLVGTIEYMAPEYFRTDIGEIGKESDLWSMGVILLEATTGKHPFGKANEGYTNGQIINNILSKEKINLNLIQDASILEIVSGLLIANPLDRHYKNIGTERKYQNEQIQNPTEINSKPKWFKKVFTIKKLLTVLVFTILIVLSVLGYKVYHDSIERKKRNDEAHAIEKKREELRQIEKINTCTEENALANFNSYMNFKYPDYKIISKPIVKEVSDCVYQIQFTSIDPRYWASKEKEIFIVEISYDYEYEHYYFKEIRGVLM